MAWWRRFLRSAPTERELRAEVDDHLERLAADYRRRGASDAEARRSAALAFGHADSIRESCRDVRRTRWLEDLVRDARYTVRGVAQGPGFAIAMVATIALGVGVSATLFSVVDAVMLRSLPFRDGDRLATLSTIDVREPAATGPVSWPDLKDWQTVAAFDGVAAFRNRPAFIQHGGEDLAVELHEVTADFLPLLAVPAERGRVWTAADARAGATPVVISHTLWRDIFGGRSDVVGQVLTASHVRYEVVGVMPAGFTSPSMTTLGVIGVSPARAVWAPFQPKPVHALRGNRGLRVLALRRGDVSPLAAQQALTQRADALAATYPDTNRGKGARLTPLVDAIAASSRRPLLALIGAAILVLLLSVTNAAALVLVRTQARTRELVLRLALGASRSRLIRQLLAESVLVAAGGTTVGLALGELGLSFLTHSAMADAVPRLGEAALDGRAMALSAAIALAMALVLGGVPAARLYALTRRGSPTPGGDRSTPGPHDARLRQTLVGGQVAIAVPLTVAAGALLISLWQLTQPPGLSAAARTLTFRTTLAGTRWSTSPADRILYDTLLERLRALPGVEYAALSSELLRTGDASTSDVAVDGRAPVAAPDRPMATYTLASPDLFRITGIRVERGRSFGRDDRADGPRVAVINPAFARATGLADPIGQRVRLSGLGPEPFEIIGVVSSAAVFDVGTSDGPRLYYHHAQVPAGRAVVLVTFAEGRSVDAAALRHTVHAIDPGLPVLDVATVAALLDQATARPRWGSTIVVALAAIALALATLGVYGLVAFAAARRTRECGIRLALGASRGDVGRLLARQALIPVGGGLAIGTFLAVLATQALLRLAVLPAAHDQHWLVVAGADVALAATAAAAGLIPAARAARRLLPAQVLRQD